MKPRAGLADPGGPPSQPSNPVDDAVTGLPGLRSWRAVYLFVFGCFVLWVVLLAALTRVFS